jgi:hypothetical protein
MMSVVCKIASFFAEQENSKYNTITTTPIYTAETALSKDFGLTEEARFLLRVTSKSSVESYTTTLARGMSDSTQKELIVNDDLSAEALVNTMN